MCRNCYHMTAVSFSPSLAITNPELVWPHHQEQKQRAAMSNAHNQAQSQPQEQAKPSSASTYSESTTYSYDKDLSQTETKQKRSMRQRIKNTLKDMGSSPTTRSEHGPMGSNPQSRT
ncbi:hypothetical protein F4677DRAFT_409798 [Hypoxylon crocopeplum]|nr:hypothetical protein F4677DRAFT_409798 [Hypoxylon crocopeplum]